MKNIAIISLKGGVGRTTVAANLGRMLAERLRVVVADVDPQNALGLHLGMTPGEPRGICNPSMDAETVRDLLRTVAPEVPFIPFGRTDDESLRELEAEVVGSGGSWLQGRLDTLCPAGTEIVVLDTPANRGCWQTAALRAADSVLAVTTPDALAYALLPETEALLHDTSLGRGPQFRGAFFVINQLDARRGLSRDLRAAFEHALDSRLVPVALYSDEAAREAVAQRQTVLRYAPHSQLSVSLRDLAQWVIESLK